MTLTALATLTAAVIPPVAPNLDSFGVSGPVQTVINGIAGLCLAGCLIGIIIGAAQMGMASSSGNSYGAADGRKKVLWCLVGGMLIFAAPTLLAKAGVIGGTVKSTIVLAQFLPF